MFPKLCPVPSSGDADRIPHAVTIRPDFLLVSENELKLEKKKRKKVAVHESQQLRNRLVKPRYWCIRRFVFRKSFRPLSSSDAVRGGRESLPHYRGWARVPLLGRLESRMKSRPKMVRLPRSVPCLTPCLVVVVDAELGYRNDVSNQKTYSQWTVKRMSLESTH